jgi:hypothetical protein
MKALLTASAAALILVGASLFTAAPAQAQGFGVQIGPGGVRIERDRPRVERRIIERRGPERRVRRGWRDRESARRGLAACTSTASHGPAALQPAGRRQWG